MFVMTISLMFEATATVFVVLKLNNSFNRMKASTTPIDNSVDIF